MSLKIKDKVITSLSMYILIFLISIYLYKIGNFEKHAIFITIGVLIMIIKDITLFFLSLEKVTTTKNSIKKLRKNYLLGDLSFGDYYIFLNRNYFFPGILIFYLLFTLLHQTDILYLSKSIFTLINTNFLGIVVVSGVMTIFKVDMDKKYKRKVKTYEGLYKNLIINILLSITGAFIIFIQTIGLGFLSCLIGLISGVLIFLVGISILEDNKSILK